MVTVLGVWESGWMDAERTERRLWKQTIQAYAVDVWAMSAVKGGPFTSPLQYATVEEMLAAHPGPKTFLIPPGRVEGSLDLSAYRHPEHAIYVFGNSNNNMVNYVESGDDVVSILTPKTTDMFAPVALAPVLYDRLCKQ